MKDLVKQTLAEQIYSILKNDIINQDIKCGEKLTLKTLQERFEISSTPIRDAMNRLSQDGLIDHVTNVGAKVIDLDHHQIKEVYDYCCILDSAALKLSFSLDFENFSKKLQACVSDQKMALDQENISDFRIHSDDFHDIFFQFADNSMLYLAAQKIRNQLSLLANKYQDYEVSRNVVFEEHKAIAEAIGKQDLPLAETLLIKHFEHGKKYMLACIAENK